MLHLYEVYNHDQTFFFNNVLAENEEDAASIFLDHEKTLGHKSPLQKKNITVVFGEDVLIRRNDGTTIFDEV